MHVNRRELSWAKAPALAALVLLASVTAHAAPPAGWTLSGEGARDFVTGIDKGKLHDGKPVVFLRGHRRKSEKSEAVESFGTLMQGIRADKYLGKRLRLSAFVQTEGVVGWAGLWLRIDCPDERVCGFDNMQDRALRGTSGWKRHEVVLDVPADGVAVVFGVLLSGHGQLRISQVRLETVDKAVPTTNLLPAAGAPKNLDFSE